MNKDLADCVNVRYGPCKDAPLGYRTIQIGDRIFHYHSVNYFLGFNKPIIRVPSLIANVLFWTNHVFIEFTNCVEMER
jgi:hypothetical protein